MDMSEPQHDNYCLIPHAHDTSVLLLQTPSGWSLPQHAEMEAPDINKTMREQLDLDVTFLRAAYDRYKDEEREEQHIVYAMENHAPAWVPPTHGAWISSGELRD